MKRLLPVLFSILAVVAGVIFVISGISTLRNKDLYDSSVTATVVDIEEDYDYSDPDNTTTTLTVYIDYEVDGKKYEHVECPETTGSMSIGDKVEILYQSQDPSKISGEHITSSGIIFIVAGALLALGGCFMTVRNILKRGL